MSNKESFRYALAVILTILYVGLLVGMFYAVLNPANVAIQAEWQNDQLKVTDILPAGMLYERGVRSGDIVIELNGRPVQPGLDVADLEHYQSITIITNAATIVMMRSNGTVTPPMCSPRRYSVPSWYWKRS